MSAINDGGPAFPGIERWTEYRESSIVDRSDPVGGMTLRDYFAGQVLSGLVMYDDNPDALWAAGQAYKLADAMLKTREAK